MIKIDEQIQWYQQNATRKDDNLIQANLKLINALYNEIENVEDKIYFDRIIDAFCEIMAIQREIIRDIMTETETNALYSAPGQHSFMTAPVSVAEIDNDKDLQAAFTAYCLQKGKSSYTVNDYCSRIKNLWKTFYEEYQKGELPEALVVIEEKIKVDCPLLNAYHHIDELHSYICMKMAGAEGNRNWANTRAAFNKFDEFKNKLKRNAEK